MSERWATIIKQEDGSEVVSNIAQMEGVPPEVRSDQKDRVRTQRVADGVKIGMIKGGKIGAVGGFGWPEGTPAPSAVPTKEPLASSNPDDKERLGEEKANTGKKAA